MFGRGAFGRAPLGRSSGATAIVTTAVGAAAHVAYSGKRCAVRVGAAGGTSAVAIQPGAATARTTVSCAPASVAAKGARSDHTTATRGKAATIALRGAQGKLQPGNVLRGRCGAIALSGGRAVMLVTPRAARSAVAINSGASTVEILAEGRRSVIALAPGTASVLSRAANRTGTVAIRPSQASPDVDIRLSGASVCLQGRSGVLLPILAGTSARIALRSGASDPFVAALGHTASIAIAGSAPRRVPRVTVTLFD